MRKIEDWNQNWRFAKTAELPASIPADWEAVTLPHTWKPLMKSVSGWQRQETSKVSMIKEADGSTRSRPAFFPKEALNKPSAAEQRIFCPTGAV